MVRPSKEQVDDIRLRVARAQMLNEREAAILFAEIDALKAELEKCSYRPQVDRLTAQLRERDATIRNLIATLRFVEGKLNESAAMRDWSAVAYNVKQARHKAEAVLASPDKETP